MRLISAFMPALLLAAQVHAQSFESFLAEVNAAEIVVREGLVESFLDSTTAPHFENGETAVFLWLGDAKRVMVTGDFTSWSREGRPMERIEGTDLWYQRSVFEPDARLDYKFVIDGERMILDPRNLHRGPGGWGENSAVHMPHYSESPEIESDSDAPHGTLSEHGFTSEIMSNERRVAVYTPAGYDPQRSEPYPVILYHDGSDYTDIAGITTILDNLIAWGQIEPVVAIFANPLDREAEYAFGDTDRFTRLIVEELMPWVETNYHVSQNPARRAITGPSYAGIASARHCFRHPEEFGLCAPFSPSLWVSDRALMNEMEASDLTTIKWYVDWGTYEEPITTDGRRFRAILEKQGTFFVANEWHEGHAWGSWRAHQDNMLEYFFPGPNPQR